MSGRCACSWEGWESCLQTKTALSGASTVEVGREGGGKGRFLGCWAGGEGGGVMVRKVGGAGERRDSRAEVVAFRPRVR